jgi:glycosyltransferase involved in cell wall biosynthesis
MKKLAFVVATKDRPVDLHRMLQSLVKQSCQPDQVVIVDSSSDPLNKVTEDFADLNISYIHHDQPSASGQRNIGIRAIAQDINLIGFLDDDVVLEPEALGKMLEFWNRASENVGGCSFNLKNHEPSGNKGLKYSALSRWLGLYSREKGVVMRSGWQTLIGNVTQNSFVQWLPSGASVWKREIFERFTFDEYYGGYSYLEDLDFSFSISKEYKLAVIADAGFYHYLSPSGRLSDYQFGKVEVRNRIYFVRKHNLSLLRCYLGIMVRFLLTLSLSVKSGNISYLYRALGNFVGITKSLLSQEVGRSLKC